MRQVMIFVIIAMVFSGAGQILTAQTDHNGFAYEIRKNGGNSLKLKITSTVSGKDLWLGISLYPPNVQNTLEEGKHLIFPVKQGDSVREIQVEPEFLNGTFEAAIWLKKLTGDDCPKEDPVCKKFGYKLDGMTAYIWGYLVAP
ncbi:MAG: hypothetical protein ACE5GL_04725 [Calditrichia bacterium]